MNAAEIAGRKKNRYKNNRGTNSWQDDKKYRPREAKSNFPATIVRTIKDTTATMGIDINIRGVDTCAGSWKRVQKILDDE